MDQWRAFLADVERYHALRPVARWRLVVQHQGLWALAEYRFSRWVRLHVRTPGLRQLLRLAGYAWHKSIEISTGIDLPNAAEIGPGLYIAHFGGIFVNCDARIGANCNISAGVVIGSGGRGDAAGCPVIGDRVFVGPGACVLGRVRIGDDVAIGANAVVTIDLPPNAVAVGNPARIVSDRGSGDYIVLPHG